MRRSHWLTALALTAILVGMPVAAVAEPTFVEVCHQSSDAAPDGREWIKLRVSSRSLETHLAHGDSAPGQEVPGSDGSLIFDEACVAEPATPSTPPEEAPAERVFAVAYSDMNASDGDYNPDVDVLVAKLIDGPDGAADGILGPGDLVVTNQYPTNFTPDQFGSFTTTQHTITDVNFVLDYVCNVSSGDQHFVWSSGDGDFDLYQEWSTGLAPTKIHDKITDATASGDEIVLDPVSPSQPSDDLSLAGSSDPVDDVFIEVETDCLS